MFFRFSQKKNRNNDLANLEAQRAYRISVQLGVHAFQEYTYKKITACDVCREILRGMCAFEFCKQTKIDLIFFITKNQ